ncbi:MAG TPA: hypothetical protein VE054_13280 [Blattabacteriaceae bacterium]|nr:hypothetical protein [Blattabacteriaceae bacterium]
MATGNIAKFMAYQTPVIVRMATEQVAENTAWDTPFQLVMLWLQDLQL